MTYRPPNHLLDREYNPIQELETDWVDIALLLAIPVVLAAIFGLYWFTLRV